MLKFGKNPTVEFEDTIHKARKKEKKSSEKENPPSSLNLRFINWSKFRIWASVGGKLKHRLYSEPWRLEIHAFIPTRRVIVVASCLSPRLPLITLVQHRSPSRLATLHNGMILCTLSMSWLCLEFPQKASHQWGEYSLIINPWSFLKLADVRLSSNTCQAVSSSQLSRFPYRLLHPAQCKIF